MKPKYLLFFLALLSFTSILYAQEVKIDNTLTEQHLSLSGTPYALLLPDASFEVSKDYTGIQNKELEAGINMTEVPMPIEVMLPQFEKDLPPKNGELLIERELLMNGYTAKLYKTNVVHKSAMGELAEPDTKGKSLVMWLLLYGNDEFCMMITGTYPSKSDEALSAKFEKSLLSFLYLSDKEINPLDALSFNISTANSPLKFSTTFMQTGAAFNLDGEFPSKKGSDITYIVMVMPFAVPEEEQKEEAINVVKKPYNDTVELKETNEIEINGLKGFEVIGYEQKPEEETPTLSYGLTLFGVEKYYSIRGSAKKDIEENLEMFRRVSSSFELKK